MLSDGVVTIPVPSLPTITPLMVPLSEEEVFIESEVFWNCHYRNDVPTSVKKQRWLMVFLQIP